MIGENEQQEILKNKFKMNVKSRKILELKQLRDIGKEQAKSQKKVAFEEVKKNPSINKNTELILFNKFESEWDHILKANQLEEKTQLTFEQFLQVLLGFRFIKHYNEDQKNMEFN